MIKLKSGNIPKDMANIKITKDIFDKAIDLYFLWKELNSGIKEYYSRGVNLPEALTEPICCYVNGFLLSLGEGSEDAVVPETNDLVQIKASSNFDRDLTSFGPQSQFTLLHFVRLNQKEDRMYLYDIPIENLKKTKVNKSQTYEEQQAQKRRPRFSIINNYIKVYDLQPYAIVDLNKKEIIRL